MSYIRLILRLQVAGKTVGIGINQGVHRGFFHYRPLRFIYQIAIYPIDRVIRDTRINKRNSIRGGIGAELAADVLNEIA